MDAPADDPRPLFSIGGWVALLSAVAMALSIPAYFAWPPVAGSLPASEVLALIHDRPWTAFLHLDTAVLFLNLLQIPLMVALFAALRAQSTSWAALALVVGVSSAVAVIPSRPLLELYALAEHHARAPSPEVLAAATALLVQFEGTGWAIATGGIPVSFLVSYVLMLRNPSFSRVTAWAGIFTSAGSLPFFVPVLGPLLLLFAGTLGGIASCALLGRDLLRLARR